MYFRKIIRHKKSLMIRRIVSWGLVFVHSDEDSYTMSFRKSGDDFLDEFCVIQTVA
jgi:hypothetical protein